ncbi:hypothetical protein B0H11DRAFT_1912985 [Mycena galericulata]|nr:hypothetical protein B0H11DRAFT_1912985 [Mycena galericulata]
MEYDTINVAAGGWRHEVLQTERGSPHNISSMDHRCDAWNDEERGTAVREKTLVHVNNAGEITIVPPFEIAAGASCAVLDLKLSSGNSGLTGRVNCEQLDRNVWHEGVTTEQIPERIWFTLTWDCRYEPCDIALASPEREEKILGSVVNELSTIKMKSPEASLTTVVDGSTRQIIATTLQNKTVPIQAEVDRGVLLARVGAEEFSDLEVTQSKPSGFYNNFPGVTQQDEEAGGRCATQETQATGRLELRSGNGVAISGISSEYKRRDWLETGGSDAGTRVQDKR